MIKRKERVGKKKTKKKKKTHVFVVLSCRKTERRQAVFEAVALEGWMAASPRQIESRDYKLICSPTA